MEEQIKASELRLGNYVIGYNDKIYQLSLYDFHLMYSGADADEIIKSFVPMNEEIFKDLGFNYDRVCFIKDGVFIGNYKNGFFYCPDGLLSRPKKEIKYLHELQNLIFAITGEELTQKEKTTTID